MIPPFCVIQGLTKEDAIVGDSTESHGKAEWPCCVDVDDGVVSIEGSPLKVLQADEYR